MIPIQDIPLIKQGDDVPQIIYQTIIRQDISLDDNDILVIAHTIFSRANGDVVDLRKITPSRQAITLARQYNKDPRHTQVVLDQGRLLKHERGIFIVETHHGFVCANGGVDRSNSGDPNHVLLLPKNPDGLAKQTSQYLKEQTQKNIAVIISDSWGRVLRTSIINVAIGSYGINPLKSYAQHTDLYGYTLRVSQVAVIDELASAAELLMGEADEAVPAVIIKGYPYEFNPTHPGAAILNRPEELRLFK